MKLLHGTGKVLEIYEAPKMVMRLTAGEYPIKFNGWKILEDEEARALVRAMMKAGAHSEKL